MTDQLNGAWGSSYMENPLDRFLPNYSMVGGPWHHMFTSTDTCRAVFRGFEGLLRHLADIRAPQHKTFC